MPRLISPLIHPCLIVVAISIALEQQNFGSTDYFFSPLCPCTRTKSMKSSFRLQHLIKKGIFNYGIFYPENYFVNTFGKE